MRPPPAGDPRHQGAHRQRKIRYIDETLQKRLLVGLVALEAGLVVGLSWLMRWQLNQTVENNLYRVHLAADTLLAQLLHEAALLLGIFLLANVLALALAHLIWHRYVDAVLALFMAVVRKVQRLDFSPDRETTRYRHRLLALTDTLRAKERHRLAAVREQVARLEAAASASGDRESLRQALDRLDELLPRPRPALGAVKLPA